MKFNFGKTSKDNLNTVCFELQILMYDALSTEIMDFSIIKGHRFQGEQNRCYMLGKSKVKWPNSKHNELPSEAVDVVPYINGKASWKKSHCCVLAGVILACAAKQGIKIRWGGNWDMDGEPITDQDFQDLVHFGLV